MAEVIYYLNDMLLELTGLQDLVDDSYVNDATVAVTLTDGTSGEEIVGETWPLTMPYVSGSDGNYRGTLVSTLTLTLGQRVIADVTVDAGLKGTGRFQPTFIVKRRGLT